MSEIVIFEEDSQQVEVRLESETVWLSQEQMAHLFERDRTVIGRHIRNVFREGELEEESNVQKMHIAGADRPTAFYDLDVIISVGYRVKSHRGVGFRHWATRVLRQHLSQGYSLNEHRLAQQGLSELEQAVDLLGQTLTRSDGATGHAPDCPRRL